MEERVIAQNPLRRIAAMALAAVIGASALGIGVTARRVYAGEPGCADYACVGSYGCASVKCDLCHSDHRCAMKTY